MASRRPPPRVDRASDASRGAVEESATRDRRRRRCARQAPRANGSREPREENSSPTYSAKAAARREPAGRGFAAPAPARGCRARPPRWGAAPAPAGRARDARGTNPHVPRGRAGGDRQREQRAIAMTTRGRAAADARHGAESASAAASSAGLDDEVDQWSSRSRSMREQGVEPLVVRGSCLSSIPLAGVEVSCPRVPRTSCLSADRLASSGLAIGE